MKALSLRRLVTHMDAMKAVCVLLCIHNHTHTEEHIHSYMQSQIFTVAWSQKAIKFVFEEKISHMNMVLIHLIGSV